MKEPRINTYIILFIIIQILFSLNYTFSQKVSEEEINKSFDSALTLFNNGKYEESLDSFTKFIIDYKNNSKTTAAEFFIAKIHLQLKQLNQFKFTADQFLELYPDSNYVDEVRLLLTKYYLEIANYYNAFREILFIIEKTNSSMYEQKAKKIGEGIAAKYLNETQLEKFFSSFTSVSVKPYILLQQGKYFIRNGDPYDAENTFEELINSYPESDEYSEAKKLMNYSYSPVSTNIIIGVMLPLETNSLGEYTLATCNRNS